MHLDLAHAIVTGLIVFGVIYAFQKAGWTEGKRFDWRLVVTVAVLVFLLNLIWPARSSHPCRSGFLPCKRAA